METSGSNGHLKHGDASCGVLLAELNFEYFTIIWNRLVGLGVFSFFYKSGLKLVIFFEYEGEEVQS